jgi:hypothetical protein
MPATNSKPLPIMALTATVPCSLGATRRAVRIMLAVISGNRNNPMSWWNHVNTASEPAPRAFASPAPKKVSWNSIQ